MNTNLRLLAQLFAGLLLFAGCGGSDASTADGGEAGTTTTEAGGTTPDPDPGVSADDPSALPGGGAVGGKLEITLDDGRSWTLNQYKCSYTPDNKGPFVPLWSAGAAVPTGGEFIVIMATSPKPEGTENSFSGSFVDKAKDIAYVAIEGEAVSDGSTMTMTLGMHDTPNRRVGDPIDLTATVTCAL